MFRPLKNPLFMVALAAGGLLFGTADRACANIELDLQEDNGTVVKVNVPDNQAAFFNGGLTTSGKTGLGVPGDFTITFSTGFGNSPGGLTALTQLGTISITNNTGSTHVLHISVSAQDFNSPQSPPPLQVLDTASGSQVSGTISGDFQGFADAGNTLFGKGFASSDLAFSVNGLSRSFSANGEVDGFSPNGSTYSESIFANYTFGANSQITLTGGNVQTVVPAPGGLVLGLSGLPFLGLGWLRRRKQPA